MPRRIGQHFSIATARQNGWVVGMKLPINYRREGAGHFGSQFTHCFRHPLDEYAPPKVIDVTTLNRLGFYDF